MSCEPGSVYRGWRRGSEQPTGQGAHVPQRVPVPKVDDPFKGATDDVVLRQAQAVDGTALAPRRQQVSELFNNNGCQQQLSYRGPVGVLCLQHVHWLRLRLRLLTFRVKAIQLPYLDPSNTVPCSPCSSMRACVHYSIPTRRRRCPPGGTRPSRSWPAPSG